jgi:LemA protein
MVIVIIIIVLLILIGLTYVLIRNSLVSLNQRVGESWSGIDVQLKRRHDLVPNLVETVKGYATHEQETFEKVTQARAAAMQASGPAQAGQAEGQLTAALGGLRVVAEQYPQLRATENFQQLQRQLSELEDEIQASRRIYNSNVQRFNTRIQQFPASMVANQMGFNAPKEFFHITEAAEREAPQVSFSTPEQPAGTPEQSPGAPEQSAG